jgi:hypothetical protein
MTTKIIPCNKGFVGKRGGRSQTMPGTISGTPDIGDALAPLHPEYLDQGGEWMPSAGGAPETVATKPFPTRETAQAGIDARAAKDGEVTRATAGELRSANGSIARKLSLLRLELFDCPEPPDSVPFDERPDWYCNRMCDAAIAHGEDAVAVESFRKDRLAALKECREHVMKKFPATPLGTLLTNFVLAHSGLELRTTDSLINSDAT